MKATPLAAIAALSAASIIGCGTIANLKSDNPDVPFGGVQRDIAMIETPRGTPQGVGVLPSMLVMLLPIEISLSIVGDVVTMPLAIGLHQSDPYNSVDGHDKEVSAPPVASPAPLLAAPVSSGDGRTVAGGTLMKMRSRRIW